VTYQSSKTFGHDLGLSSCFRQWRAHSHCRFLHGYALSIHLEFETEELDERNWCVDFGSLKPFRQQLENTFDHKLLVAEDDPRKEDLLRLQELGLAQVVMVEATGCEAFARLVFECAEIWLKDAGYAPRVRMHSVTVREHGANSATYRRTARPPVAYDPSTGDHR
jgi:6-pyruvoyltetrahydropterin/6-carboxytetrahydropterin synthase